MMKSPTPATVPPMNRGSLQGSRDWSACSTLAHTSIPTAPAPIHPTCSADREVVYREIKTTGCFISGVGKIGL